MIKNILKKIISSIESDKIYILLSASTYSQALLYTALKLNKTVIAVSFTFKTKVNRDFECAENIAKKYNIEFLPVLLDDSLENIADSALELGNKYECKTKREFEKIFPMLSVYNAINKHSKDKATLISGIGSHIYSEYPYIRNKCITIRKQHKKDDPPSVYIEKRLEGKYNCQIRQHKILEEKFNIKHEMPYLDKEISNICLNFNWSDVNEERLKELIYEDFKKQIMYKKDFYSSNYHLKSSFVADAFFNLTKTKWNYNNWKTQVGIYNAISKGLINKDTYL